MYPSLKDVKFVCEYEREEKKAKLRDERLKPIDTLLKKNELQLDNLKKEENLKENIEKLQTVITNLKNSRQRIIDQIEKTAYLISKPALLIGFFRVFFFDL